MWRAPRLLFLRSGSGCLGCIKFHVKRQGTSLGEHGEVSSQEVDHNSKQSSNKRGPSNMLTSTYHLPCVQSIPLENIEP